MITRTMGALALMTGVTMAQDMILSAPDAAAQLDAGDLVLLDIRSPAEWAQTGIAHGALPVTLHDRDFGRNLEAVRQRLAGRDLALICATGGRTGHVVSVLKANGITDVVDLSEGMMGNPHGPGWIARSLPLWSREEGQAALEVYMSAPPR